MLDKTRPMDIGDIFSNTFNLLKDTFSRNIIIALTFLIPAGLLTAYGFNVFFSGMMNAAKAASENSYLYTDYNFKFIFENIGIYIFSLIIFFIGYISALIGITKISCGSIDGERINTVEAFRNIFSVNFWRCTGQQLLLALIIIGCIFACVIAVAIAFSIHKILGLLIAVFVIPSVTAAILYLTFSWYFAFITIVNENKGIFESFSRSSSLVKGLWWRTFGIIILISVLVDFAVSVVSTPVSFIFLWDFISQYFKMLSTGTFNQNDPEVIFKMMDSFGFTFGILIIISTILDVLITPLFNVAYYYDLRIRKNEFNIPPAGKISNAGGQIIE